MRSQSISYCLSLLSENYLYLPFESSAIEGSGRAVSTSTSHKSFVSTTPRDLTNPPKSKNVPSFRAEALLLRGYRRETEWPHLEKVGTPSRRLQVLESIDLNWKI